MIDRRQFAATVGMTLFAASRAIAQSGYPNKPITIIVPFAPGGPTDVMARSLGQGLAESMGQPVIVENKPGAGGQLAGSTFIRDAADGYTLLVGDFSMLGLNVGLYKNFSWNPPKDARGVAPLLIMPMVLVVPQSSPYNSVAELLAAAKTKNLNFASQGPGTMGHLLGEMLREATGGNYNHVPYRGTAPAVNDLLAGQVDMLFEGLGAVLQHVRAGKLKCLAVASPERLPQLPDVPTTTEAGLASVKASTWFGLVAPRATPDAIVLKLNEEIKRAMALPSIRTRFGDLGFQFVDMSAPEFDQFMKKEAEHWIGYVRQHNITVE